MKKHYPKHEEDENDDVVIVPPFEQKTLLKEQQPRDEDVSEAPVYAGQEMEIGPEEVAKSFSENEKGFAENRGGKWA
jgi:hypothetical protein